MVAAAGSIVGSGIAFLSPVATCASFLNSLKSKRDMLASYSDTHSGVKFSARSFFNICYAFFPFRLQIRNVNVAFVLAYCLPNLRHNIEPKSLAASRSEVDRLFVLDNNSNSGQIKQQGNLAHSSCPNRQCRAAILF